MEICKKRLVEFVDKIGDFLYNKICKIDILKKGVVMEQLIKENEIEDTINDYFDIKLIEADKAIKNGAKYYTREEVDNILSTIMKQNVYA